MKIKKRLSTIEEIIPIAKECAFGVTTRNPEHCMKKLAEKGFNGVKETLLEEIKKETKERFFNGIYDEDFYLGYTLSCFEDSIFITCETPYEYKLILQLQVAEHIEEVLEKNYSFRTFVVNKLMGISEKMIDMGFSVDVGKFILFENDAVYQLPEEWDHVSKEITEEYMKKYYCDFYFNYLNKFKKELLEINR